MKAANVAVHAACGGDDTISRWKLMAEARQKSSPGPGRNSKKHSGETGKARFYDLKKVYLSSVAGYSCV